MNKKTVVMIVGFFVMISLSPVLQGGQITKDQNLENQNDTIQTESYFFPCSISSSPRYPDPGEEITFHAELYTLTFSYANRASWSFGDGTTSNEMNPKHTYGEKGSYFVQLTIHVIYYDSIDHCYKWGSARDSKTIHVGADPFPIFTWTPPYPKMGETVTLDASESYDPDGEIVEYNWSYYTDENPNDVVYIGDTENLDYLWQEQGNYNVNLTVKDDLGNVNSNIETIQISILDIEKVKGGYKKILINLGNKDDIVAENVVWNASVYGGLMRRYLGHGQGSIESLEPDDVESVTANFRRRAFGRVRIYIDVHADNAVEISKTVSGFIFGRYIIIR